MRHTDPDGRLLILVATKPKLDLLTAFLEIHPAINSYATGVFDIRAFEYLNWAKIARDFYQQKEAKTLSEHSIEDVLLRFNKSAGFGMPAVVVDPMDAKKNFDFGIGHIPKDGNIYIQHPIDRNTYISPVEFSRSICAEKEAAFLRLAASLGAKSIKLTSIQSNDTKGVFGGKFTAQEIAMDLGFKASFDKSGNVAKEIVKEFNKPNFNTPFVPAELLAWVNVDPDLRIMASDRLEANVARSNVKLQFAQNLGLGGELSAKIAQRGLSTDGSFKAVAKSFWSFEVEYFDMSPPEYSTLSG